ncbi:MAG: acetamidase [Tissierellia bacterium]|nr:acetamidase [Tissierellia bacterium]
MVRIPRDKVIYEMSKDNKAVVEVEINEAFVVETHDCYTGTLKDESQPASSVPWEKINPATGPIYIKGAKPGDILVVNIDKIQIQNKCVMATQPGLGVTGDSLKSETTRLLDVVDNQVVFNDKVRIPIRPMIGVIGVAPEKEPVLCGTPEAHGGNMDCAEIVEGTKLYLPVFHEGALLALGDVHAVMADGEVSVTGAEVPAEVTLTCDIIKEGQKYLAYPMLTNDEKVMVIHSAETLEKAVKGSVEDSIRFLGVNYAIDEEEALRLLSLAGDVRICQVVDPLMTVRVEMSRTILDQLGDAHKKYSL